MNEGLREPDLDQPLLEPARDLEPAAPFRAATGRGWLRLAYAVEFFLAILTVLTLWGEVGGQGHMDLLPWYVKLIGIVGCAWCCVRFTAGLVEQPSVWNRRTAGWFTGILLFGIMMGSITYYYHLHEESDDDTDDTTSTVSVTPASWVHYQRDGTRS